MARAERTMARGVDAESKARLAEFVLSICVPVGVDNSWVSPAIRNLGQLEARIGLTREAPAARREGQAPGLRHQIERATALACKKTSDGRVNSARPGRRQSGGASTQRSISRS
jgi:hypothetical protein